MRGGISPSSLQFTLAFAQYLRPVAVVHDRRGDVVADASVDDQRDLAAVTLWISSGSVVHRRRP